VEENPVCEYDNLCGTADFAFGDVCSSLGGHLAYGSSVTDGGNGADPEGFGFVGRYDFGRTAGAGTFRPGGQVE
jgi:hypothetical protein